MYTSPMGNLETRIWRRVTDMAFPSYMPVLLGSSRGGYEETGKYLRETVVNSPHGAIFAVNHFSKEEMTGTGALLARFIPPETTILAPINWTYLQPKVTGPAMQYLMDHSNGLLAPIVNDSTIDKINERAKKGKKPYSSDPPSKLQSVKNYMRMSREVLSRGGVVVVAPQATRYPEGLTEPQGTMRSFLTAALNNKDEDGPTPLKPLIIPVGVSLNGVHEYGEKTKDYNPMHRLIYRMGDPIHPDEVLALDGPKEKPFGHADELVYATLAGLIDPGLRGVYSDPARIRPTLLNRGG